MSPPLFTKARRKGAASTIAASTASATAPATATIGVTKTCAIGPGGLGHTPRDGTFERRRRRRGADRRSKTSSADELGEEPVEAKPRRRLGASHRARFPSDLDDEIDRPSVEVQPPARRGARRSAQREDRHAASVIRGMRTDVASNSDAVGVVVL